MASRPHLRVASRRQQQLAFVGRQESAICSRSSAGDEGDNVPLRFEYRGQEQQRCVSEVVTFTGVSSDDCCFAVGDDRASGSGCRP